MLSFLMAFVFEGIGSFIIWLFRGFKGEYKDVFYVENEQKRFKLFKRAIGLIIAVFLFFLIRNVIKHNSHNGSGSF
jgi:hypothetical protein